MPRVVAGRGGIAGAADTLTMKHGPGNFPAPTGKIGFSENPNSAPERPALRFGNRDLRSRHDVAMAYNGLMAAMADGKLSLDEG
jgi:hypothetical protein